MVKKILVLFSALACTLTMQAKDSKQPDSPHLRTQNAIECMALNIYYETHASSLIDAMAVSDVVLNRVFDTRYPDTVCKVVKQAVMSNGTPVKNKCQFSWYCDNKPDNPKDSKKWALAQAYAKEFLNAGRFRGITEGATHYHAHYVKPAWRKTKTKIARVGAHIFYRWD